jgi:hypothetical protein
VKFCVWTFDEDTDSWDTSCGEKWVFMDGGPVENRVSFCHYCGMQVAVKVELSEDEDG